MQDWAGQLVEPGYIKCLKMGLGIVASFAKYSEHGETLILSVCCSMNGLSVRFYFLLVIMMFSFVGLIVIWGKALSVCALGVQSSSEALMGGTGPG